MQVSKKKKNIRKIGIILLLLLSFSIIKSNFSETNNTISFEPLDVGLEFSEDAITEKKSIRSSAVKTTGTGNIPPGPRTTIELPEPKTGVVKVDTKEPEVTSGTSSTNIQTTGLETEMEIEIETVISTEMTIYPIVDFYEVPYFHPEIVSEVDEGNIPQTLRPVSDEDQQYENGSIAFNLSW